VNAPIALHPQRNSSYAGTSGKKDLEHDEKLLIQVSYSVADIETKNRETNALENAMRDLKIKQATLITYDEEETIATDDYSIQEIPIWQWLLIF
jgi:predicted AAA+ superfamily ATPase